MHSIFDSVNLPDRNLVVFFESSFSDTLLEEKWDEALQWHERSQVWAAGFLVFAVRDGVAWSLAILSRPGELLSRIRDSKSVSASLIRRIPPQLIVYDFEAGRSGQPAARLLKEFMTRIIASSLRRTLASVRPSVVSRLTFRTCDVKGLGKVEDCALVMLELFQVFMH